MSELVNYRDGQTQAVGQLRARMEGVSIRLATAEDLPWIDGLQKKNAKAVGFQFMAALEKRVEKGDILVAEVGGEVGDLGTWGPGDLGRGGAVNSHSDHPSPQVPKSPSPQPVGYLMGTDRYYQRDDVGIIYQICIEEKYRRSLVAGMLLQAQFDKSAYGCRLYCCWCAQDLAANQFWEAMGFVPIAFRTGSEKNKVKGPDGKVLPGPRMHIFWQKRVRAGDVGDLNEGGTPWWFPSETRGGAMGASRVALPIPPGTRWFDAKPVVLPAELAALPAPESFEVSDEEVAEFLDDEFAIEGGADEVVEGVEIDKVESAVVVGGGSGGFRFGPSEEELAAQGAAREAAAKEALKEKKKAVRKATKKAQKKRAKQYDPRLLAFSRELRDRWQEEVLVNPGLLLGVAEGGRYDVRRLIGPTGLAGCGGGGEIERDVIEVEGEKVTGVKRLGRAA